MPHEAPPVNRCATFSPITRRGRADSLAGPPGSSTCRLVRGHEARFRSRRRPAHPRALRGRRVAARRVRGHAGLVRVTRPGRHPVHRAADHHRLRRRVADRRRAGAGRGLPGVPSGRRGAVQPRGQPGAGEPAGRRRRCRRAHDRRPGVPDAADGQGHPGRRSDRRRRQSPRARRRPVGRHHRAGRPGQGRRAHRDLRGRRPLRPGEPRRAAAREGDAVGDDGGGERPRRTHEAHLRPGAGGAGLPHGRHQRRRSGPHHRPARRRRQPVPGRPDEGRRLPPGRRRLRGLARRPRGPRGAHPRRVRRPVDVPVRVSRSARRTTTA